MPPTEFLPTARMTPPRYEKGLRLTQILDAEGVRVQYGSLVAVQRLDVRLEAGQLMGLIGPNGAGKTSFFRALAGLQPLTAGRVRVLGDEVLPGRHAALSRIGFAPDTPPVYDTLTVAQFLEFIGRAYGLLAATIEERIGFWLDQLWLADKRNEKISSLSRGMRQRLTIARTLLPDPVFILLDEPSAGLDPAGRVQFRQLLTSLREQGKALIVSSHILADLHEYCTHIGIIEAGRLRQFGTVAEVVMGQASDRSRYRMTLARAMPDAAAKMQAIEGMSGLRVDGREVVFEYAEDREKAAALLATLVGAGLPVASFAAIELDLEEAYLRAGIRQVD